MKVFLNRNIVRDCKYFINKKKVLTGKMWHLAVPQKGALILNVVTGSTVYTRHYANHVGFDQKLE